MIKQVIFDLGRVLLEWQPEKLAHELSLEDESFVKEVWHITRHPTWLQFDMGQLRSPDLIDIHAEKYPKRTLQQFMDRVPHILTLIPEGLRLLEAVKEKGLKRYILSNMSHDFYHHLIAVYPFLSEFDGSIYSCHFNLAKPDHSIYHKLLNKYHLTPNESLFVDDIPENIASADSLGIHTVLFTKEEKTYNEFMKKLNS